MLEEVVTGLPSVINLFDVAIHPDFSQNRRVYLAYAARNADGVGLEVIRARLVENQLVNKEIVFRAAPKVSPAPLSGGRLLFAADDVLLASVGDQRDGLSDGQDPSNHLGSIVRVTDGHVDNTNDEQPTHVSVLPEIYTYGHRNVQGLALDSETGQVWIVEHGPSGGDELNRLREGGNYGWPTEHFGDVEETSSASDEKPKHTFEKPASTWTPAIAPSGLAVYRGSRFSEWADSMFVGSLVDCQVLRLRLGRDGRIVSEEALLGEFGERVRDIRVGPDEALYVLTDEVNGKLIRFEPLAVAQASSLSTHQIRTSDGRRSGKVSSHRPLVNNGDDE